MKRDIYSQLLEWKGSSGRKPLILRGARQTGKTYILKEFARREYANSLYLNFEEDPTLDAVFRPPFDMTKLLRYAAAYGGVQIQPASTLIILDEIQASENALLALKYLNEHANEYPIAAAGSLLGIKLGGKKSFPVGKVNFLNLYPLSFLEFLDAMGKSALRLLIEEAAPPYVPFPEPVHLELVDHLKNYYFLGGMPEAVETFRRSNSFAEARRVQRDILDAYLLDFSKHAEKIEILRISAVWNSIPLHLSRENRRFIFSAVKKGARAREYEAALQWLLDAGLICRSCQVGLPHLPLAAHAAPAVFKVYLLDVGLLGALANLSHEAVMKGGDALGTFQGALVENYVAQQLREGMADELYYWSSPGKAEVDFVFAAGDAVYPLEVKAGVSRQSKSLKVYDGKYHPPALSRASLRNLKTDGRFRNYPLYAVSLFPK